jgi:hypothetical protein
MTSGYVRVSMDRQSPGAPTALRRLVMRVPNLPHVLSVLRVHRLPAQLFT